MIPEIKNEKNNLKKAINNPSTTMEEIVDISKRIDNLIKDNYTFKKANSQFEKKYKKILNRKDKSIVITQIKSDLLNAHSDISIIELDILANNIYDFCCLTIHQITDSEIQEYFSYKNRLYYNRLSDNQLNHILPTNLKEIRFLSQKYIKLLKSNKESK